MAPCGAPAGTVRGRSRLAGLDDFAEMYDDHIWDVYGFIAYRVADREEAEDLTQTTFERALKAWSRFDPERSSLKTWLIAIARNLVIDHYRSDKSKMTSSLDLPSRDEHERESGAADDAPSLGPDPELEAALKNLSQRQREVIALRFGGDLSSAQIAGLTGLSEDNVQQILSRSLRGLRDELKGSGLGP